MPGRRAVGFDVENVFAVFAEHRDAVFAERDGPVPWQGDDRAELAELDIADVRHGHDEAAVEGLQPVVERRAVGVDAEDLIAGIIPNDERATLQDAVEAALAAAPAVQRVVQAVAVDVFFGVLDAVAVEIPAVDPQERRRMRPPDDARSDVADTEAGLGLLLYNKGPYDEAEPLTRKALEKHPDVAISLYNLGRLLQAKGDEEEAETLYRQALIMSRELLGETHPGVAEVINRLVSLLKDRGDLAEAETLRVEHATTLQDELGATHEQTQKALRRLVAFYEATGAQQKAAASRALLAGTDP